MSRETMLSNIPDYKVFLTVDELNSALKKLAEEFPGVVSVFEAGRSRKGEPILCAKIGNGSRNALFYGCPHPNEPIGAMMCHYFARAIAQDEAYRNQLDFTFYIVPVSDVDGTKLNENWFKGPFTIYNYARNFFRPAGEEQVEWTFPIKYKNYEFNAPLPETRALMKLIDETRPEFIYSLHNAGFGGAYWYVSSVVDKSVYDGFHKAAERGNVPLDLGEPEMPFVQTLAPAVFKMINASNTYDFYEEFAPGNPETMMAAGDCSASYAGAGTAFLVTELPYFYDPRVNSGKLLDFTRKEAVLKKLDASAKHLSNVSRLYNEIKPYYSEGNPFAAMLAMYTRTSAGSQESERAFTERDEQFNDMCRESEAFSNLYASRFYHLLTWGLLIRSAEYELIRAYNALLTKVKDEAEEILKNAARELENELNYSVIPIKNLVGIQLECGLCVMESLKKQ